MFFLNFTIGEFLILFSALAGLITALYLLERSKRTKVVSTLRFWAANIAAPQQQSRKRIRDPWSFLLQLVSVLLLLLAIGQLEWGSREHAGRRHVLLVDTSAWAGERAGRGTLIDAEKRMALQYLERIPENDQVLLAAVDAFTTPATPFAANHAQLANELRKLQPSYTALNMGRALSFASRLDNFSAGASGEIVYVGPARIQKGEDPIPSPSNLRTIVVQPDLEDCGIRRLGFRRDDQSPGLWHASATIENYGARERALHFHSAKQGKVLDSQSVTLGPQQEVTLHYSFFQEKEARLTTWIDPDDSLPADDGVTLQIPGDDKITLAVFTHRPEAFKPLTDSASNVRAVFFTPDQYSSHPAADVIVLDQMSPPEQPKIPALWIAPPQTAAPLPVKQIVKDAAIEHWNTANLGINLRTKDARVKTASVFQTGEDGDIVIASVAGGPVIVARNQSHDGQPKFAVFGFDPLQSELRFQTTGPLLFASLLRWLSPEWKQVSDVTASLVGETNMPLSSGNETMILGVQDEKGTQIPFDVHNGLLQLFTSRPSTMHIESASGTNILCPVLADVAEETWIPPAGSLAGLPQRAVPVPTALSLWKWLALAGGVGLFIDWFLFGYKRRSAFGMASARDEKDQVRQRELVSK